MAANCRSIFSIRLPRTPANGLLGGQFDAEATALPNGNFVLVYTNNAGGEGDLDILAVEMNAAGNVVAGSTFRVDFDAGNQVTADVAPRVGGGYTAVWEDRGADGNNNNFISLAVIAPGTPSDPDAGELKVEDTSTTTTLLQPAIATFDDGTYIVAYTRQYAIRGRRYSRRDREGRRHGLHHRRDVRRLSRCRRIPPGTTAPRPPSLPSAAPPWWSIGTSS